MSKEAGKIYPSSNLGAIKVRTRHINGIGIGIVGYSGGSGHGGVRVCIRGQGGGCGTHKIDISKYVDGTETYVPQELWS